MSTHVPRGEDTAEQDAEEEAIVLEMDVVDNQETGVRDDGRGENGCRRRVRLEGPSSPSVSVTNPSVIQRDSLRERAEKPERAGTRRVPEQSRRE